MKGFQGALLIAAAMITTGMSVAAIAQTPVDASTVPSHTGSKLPKAEAQAALDFHNAKRREVGSPPLVWSAELSVVAQGWADRLASERQCGLMHKPDNNYGENLFGGSGAAWTATDASRAWYDEIKDYQHAVLDDGNWYATGHYTQMVWNTTTQLGMGVARCANGAMVITAEYDPAGNIMGRAAY